MRVLLLTPEYPPIGGGAANACFYLVKEMRELGAQVDVLTLSTTREVEREAGPGGEVIVNGVSTREFYPALGCPTNSVQG